MEILIILLLILLNSFFALSGIVLISALHTGIELFTLQDNAGARQASPFVWLLTKSTSPFMRLGPNDAQGITIGGLIRDKLGQLSVAGVQSVSNGFHFGIADMEDECIDTILVTTLNQKPR